MIRWMMGLTAMLFLATCYLLFLAIGGIAALMARWAWGRRGKSADVVLGCIGSILGGVLSGNITGFIRMGPASAIVLCWIGAFLFLALHRMVHLMRAKPSFQPHANSAPSTLPAKELIQG